MSGRGRGAVLTAAVVAGLVLGGCGAGGGDGDGDGDDRAATETVIGLGAAFEHDGYEVDAGWETVADGLGDLTVEGMRVTNTDDTRRQAALELLFRRDGRVVVDLTCLSEELGPGESSPLDCYTTDAFTEDVDEVTVGDGP